MSVSKPYFNTSRQLTDGSYSNGGNGNYVRDRNFAKNGQNYIRSFLLLQEDLLNIFEFIEPTTANLPAYSMRNFSLLLRLCTEVEANFKAILGANTYDPKRDWDRLNMGDYRRTNASHFLSSYEVKLPQLHSSLPARRPFENWEKPDGSLGWYKAYNGVKHNRSDQLSLASLDNVVSAFSALVAVLAAQYNSYDFDPVDRLVAKSSDYDGFESMLGGPLVRFPSIPVEERYDFDWAELKQDPSPFRKFDYNAIEVV